ncbi:MAG: methanogenesis marker 12 protein [Methanobacteriota archaeon]|nr:MAG: methanogenesis marker 12 protein [Euryarchaeota archaeon]
MAATLGVDHGTEGLRFCLLKDGKTRFLEVGREDASGRSVLPLLEERGFLDADLIGLTYSMADGIDAITDLRLVERRGQREAVTGEFSGGGTRLFDEIKGSGRRAVLIPGMHRGIRCLDRRFRFLYSHMAASEKTALAYHAYLMVNREIAAPDMIIADISSNTVTVGIACGRLFGAVDACLGAPGLVHGPLDLGRIRLVDSGRLSANQAFYSAGVSKMAGLGIEEVLDGRDEKADLAREALIAAVEMEVAGLSRLIRPQAIVIAGSAGIHRNIFGRLKEVFEETAPVYRLDRYGAAEGAAEIAQGILQGEREFLGVGVNLGADGESSG